MDEESLESFRDLGKERRVTEAKREGVFDMCEECNGRWK